MWWWKRFDKVKWEYHCDVYGECEYENGDDTKSGIRSRLEEISRMETNFLFWVNKNFQRTSCTFKIVLHLSTITPSITHTLVCFCYLERNNQAINFSNFNFFFVVFLCFMKRFRKIHLLSFSRQTPQIKVSQCLILLDATLPQMSFDNSIAISMKKSSKPLSMTKWCFVENLKLTCSRFCIFVYFLSVFHVCSQLWWITQNSLSPIAVLKIFRIFFFFWMFLCLITKPNLPTTTGKTCLL